MSTSSSFRPRTPFTAATITPAPTVAAPTPSTASAPSSPISGSGTSDQLARFNDLQAQGQALQQIRLRHQFDLDNSEQECQECESQGKAFNVNSLEELILLDQQQQAADKAALDAYEKALQDEREFLDALTQQLAALDRPVSGGGLS